MPAAGGGGLSASANAGSTTPEPQVGVVAAMGSRWNGTAHRQGPEEAGGSSGTDADRFWVRAADGSPHPSTHQRALTETATMTTSTLIRLTSWDLTPRRLPAANHRRPTSRGRGGMRVRRREMVQADVPVTPSSPTPWIVPEAPFASHSRSKMRNSMVTFQPSASSPTMVARFTAAATCTISWRARLDSNQRPLASEANALSI